MFPGSLETWTVKHLNAQLIKNLVLCLCRANSYVCLVQETHRTVGSATATIGGNETFFPIPVSSTTPIEFKQLIQVNEVPSAPQNCSLPLEHFEDNQQYQEESTGSLSRFHVALHI